MDRGVIDAAERVTDVESFAMTRRLWTEEGLLRGRLLRHGGRGRAARRERWRLDGPVVVVLPDSWDRYLSKEWAARP